MSDLDDERISALYQRMTDDEPSAESDRLLIEAAHVAVKRRPRRSFVQSLALAATVVLGIGVGWKVWLSAPQLEHDAPVQAEPSAAAAKPSMQPAPPPATEGVSRIDAEDFLRRQAAPEPPAESPIAPPSAPTLKDVLRSEARKQQPWSPAGVVTMPQCPDVIPAQRQDKAAWQNAIATAHEHQDQTRESCLRFHYRREFGEDAP